MAEYLRRCAHAEEEKRKGARHILKGMKMKIGDCVSVPATRRNVRVSPKEAKILSLLLAEDREMYGYEIMKITNGEISLASVYSLLGRLEGKGLVTSRLENVTAKGFSIPRRWYKPTAGLEASRRTIYEVPPDEGIVEVKSSATPGMVPV